LRKAAKMIKLAVYGSDGFGREVLPMVRQSFDEPCDIVFVDDQAAKWGTVQNGVQITSFDAALKERRQFSIAIANAAARKKVADRIADAGGTLFSARAASATIYDDVQIGVGSILCANVTLTSNIRIGRCFHANIYSYVGHDCEIGDFVTFGPRVSCNGRVMIGNGAYIGTGALLKQGTHEKCLVIGEGATVGMGAVVTKDVAPGAVVVGNPARPLEPKS
jgi:sugar O-acyltransferase (sialic acid O-acetyltransferase NeuD family)